MSQIASLLLFIFSSLAIFSIARAQDRAPHGLAHESPLVFPPSAADFFHPKTREPENKNPCASSKCSPLPLAAQFDDATQAHESRVSTTQKSGNRVAAGGIAGIVVASAFVVLLAMGASYAVITSRASMKNPAIPVKPEA